MSNLLEIRRELKYKKPDFIRQDYQRRKRLGRKLKWRKPKGIHSKIRHHFKGRRKIPSPGYKSPRKVKGLHNLGLKMINVATVKDVGRIKKESEGIIISKKVGTRKRLEILKKAKELNVTVLNLNTDEQIKKIEDFINSKKKKIAKETKKEEIKESKEVKEKAIQELTDEQKKESNASELSSKRTRSQINEKKEKDRILTKKV